MSQSSQPPTSITASHRSLKAWARREGSAASQLTRWRRWLRTLRQALRAVWSSLLVLGPLFLGVFVLLFSVGHHIVPVLPWVSGLSDKAQFLTTLWQVLASALALSIAVVLFAFQAGSNSPNGTTLREFAQESHLIQVFLLSVPSLVIVGLTLLSEGRGQPSDWRTSLALISSGLTFVAIPAMLVLTLRALDPEIRHQRRLARIRRVVHVAVAREVRDRIAASLMKTEAAAWGLSFFPGPFRGPVPSGFQPVRVDRPGYVWDIRLRRMADLVRMVGAGSIHLVTSVGTSLSEQSALVWLREGTSGEHLRKVPKAIRVRRVKSDNLNRAIDSLHGEAVSHITATRKAEYGAVAEGYRELLLAFPVAWAEYGAKFEAGIAQGLSFFPGDVERVQRNLYEEMTLSLQHGGREVASAAAGIPARIAAGALPLGATALIRGMLRLLVEGYRICRVEPGMALATLMERRFINLIVEFARYYIVPVLDDDSRSDEVREGYGLALGIAFELIRDALKAMLDTRDFEGLTSLDAAWSELLRYWNPEQATLRDWNLDLRLRGVTDPVEEQRLRDRARRAEEANRLKDRLVHQQEVLYFDLAVWSLRSWLADTDPEFFEKAFKLFAARFNSLDMAVRVAGLAIRYDQSDLPAWVNWIMFEEARGGALDTLGPALRTFVVLAALRAPTNVGSTSLEPDGWLLSNKASLVELIESVRGQPQLQTLGTQWGLRLDNLNGLIETAAGHRQALDRAALASATVDPTKVEVFRESILDGWAKSRLGEALHARYGRVVSDEGPRPGIFWSEAHWLSKRFFLPDYQPESSFAEEIGRRLAASEMTDFLMALGRAATSAHGAAVFEERLEEALGALRNGGFSPHVALCPSSWRLRQRLFEAWWPLPEDVPPWLPEQARHWYMGITRGLLCFEWPDVPTDRMYLVDMLQFSRMKQWKGLDHLVEFHLTTYAAAEALALAKDRPQLMAAEGRDEQRRAEEIQQSVVLAAQVRHEVEVVNREAARAILLPSELND